MRHSILFLGTGVFFVALAAGLLALAKSKPKAGAKQPTKSELREQAALAAETQKMRKAALVCAGLGVAMIVFSALS
jgi:hypothetical protein